MRMTFFTLVLLAASSSSPAAAQAAVPYHDAVYLVGGAWYPRSSPPYRTGVNKLDNTHSLPFVTRLTEPDALSHFCMDSDNRHVVVSVRGGGSPSYPGYRLGLFRYDPPTRRLTTIYRCYNPSPTAFHTFRDTVIDYNGDYISAVYVYDRAKPSRTGYSIWKTTPLGLNTTILATTALGRPGYFYGCLRTNIDTGKILVWDARLSSGVRRPILEVHPDRINGWSTWSTGGTDGWMGYYAMPQNHRTGSIEGPYGADVFRIQPGNTSRTKLFSLGGLPYPIYGSGDFDLQTACKPRQVFVSYAMKAGHYQTWLYLLDTSTPIWTVTKIAVSSMRTYNYDFDFYRGRHTQTMRTAPRRWDVRLSAPRFPNRLYVVGLSLSGVRPGVRLCDCRRLNFHPDFVTLASTSGGLSTIWNPGPGRLDANGEARGWLDLSGYPEFNVPLWIAWVVLDPRAPCGIAYIPDTYVMRI